MRPQLLAACGALLVFGVVSAVVAVASPWNGSGEEVGVESHDANDESQCLTASLAAQLTDESTDQAALELDSDADGVKDIAERFACSDPSDPDSLPEVLGHEDTCSDGRDNDLNGDTDGEDAKCSDRDGDEWPDRLDNCPETDNSDQLDNDEDGLGAECDTDDDGDSVADDIDEACPDTPRGEEVDESGCADSEVDSDGDGVCDATAESEGPSGCEGSDNCASDRNPEQTDSDAWRRM
jgi:hypothetical protein